MSSFSSTGNGLPRGEMDRLRPARRARRDAHLLGLLVMFLSLLGSGVARGQTASEEPAEIVRESGGEEMQTLASAPVRLDGRTLFELRGASAYPAKERAAAVAERIRDVAADRTVATNQLRAVDQGLQTDILAGDSLLVTLVDADGRRESLTREELALVLVARIREAVESYRSERSPESLLRAGALAAAFTVLLVLVLFVFGRTTRWIRRTTEGRYGKRVRGVRVQSFDLIGAEVVWSLLQGLRRTLNGLFVLVVLYIYLRRTLSLFPWTRIWAGRLVDLVLGPLRTMGEAVLAEIPNLAFVVVLAFVVRFALKGLRLFFAAVEQGSVTIGGFAADWAQPTYKILRLMVLAFAVVVAYPYLPGSETAAFKGVTIFLGVIFSLGGSSFVGNVVAGHTMTYRRAFKVGDVVTIGDIFGTVTELRLLVTHLRTLRNEEVVIPNSLILNSNVVNHSSFARDGGLLASVKVGIGYDVPWRQVEALLLAAAQRTPGCLAQPAPFVLHRSLDDYAISYELCVYHDEPIRRAHLVTVLHRNVLDVFNEYGVQIMTPSYERDPETPKLVPPSEWFAAPAREPSDTPAPV